MSKNRKRGSKNRSLVILIILLVLTILCGVLGVTGMKLPPNGLWKLLPWLPTTDSENWPEVLALGLDLRGGVYVEYSAEAVEGIDASFSLLMNDCMGFGSSLFFWNITCFPSADKKERV